METPVKRVTFDDTVDVHYYSEPEKEPKCYSVVYDGTTIVLVNGQYAYSRPNQVVVIRARNRRFCVRPRLIEEVEDV